jgi:hypothetical protein
VRATDKFPRGLSTVLLPQISFRRTPEALLPCKRDNRSFPGKRLLRNPGIFLALPGNRAGASRYDSASENRRWFSAHEWILLSHAQPVPRP